MSYIDLEMLLESCGCQCPCGEACSCTTGDAELDAAIEAELAQANLAEASTSTGATSAGKKKDGTGSLVRHCMVAVSKKLTGASRDKARGARNICQAQMSKYGYLKKEGKTYRQTQKGMRRSMKHSMEKDNPAKQREYERMTKQER